ncbi:MAG: DegV family protein [Brockia lithotrophica]|nr:DegV family protein [Brockia lithotrophica]
MGERIAWIIDSTSNIDPEFARANDVRIVYLSVVFGERVYRENLDIGEGEFLRRLREERALPTTTQPTIGEFVDLYTRLKASYDLGIAVHISSGLSGTWATSVKAAEMVGFPLYAVDSKMTVHPMVWILEEGMRLHRAGKPVEVVVRWMNEVASRLRALFVVDDISHLHRGGRLTRAEYIVGSLLRIKPILTFEDGRIVPFGKERTLARAKARVFAELDRALAGADFARVSVIHCDMSEEARRWEEELRGRYGDKIELVLRTFPPVIAAHVGPGTVGFGWYTLSAAERAGEIG